MSKNFFKAKNINSEDIIHITRDNRKSVLKLVDGRTIETFETIKNLMQTAGTENLLCINKGVVVNQKYIKTVNNNKYIMSDGVEFYGRARASQKQKECVKNVANCEQSNWMDYSVVENMPLAFCIIELVFDKNNSGIDFIFRYCNKEMENLEGKTVQDMLNKSFYQIFENGDKKWIAAYADVAINGVQRVFESYSPEIDSNLRVYCYQPKPNFCACTLIKI